MREEGEQGTVYEGIGDIGDRMNIPTTLIPFEQAGSKTPKEQEEKTVMKAYNLTRRHPGKAGCQL